MLNKLKAYITLAISAVLFTPIPVFATEKKDPDITGGNFIGGVIDSANQADTLTDISNVLKTFLGFARGAGIIVCVIMLAWCAIQLAMSSGNQQKRQMAMDGIKNVLIAVAIIGSATLISSLAYGLLG